MPRLTHEFKRNVRAQALRRYASYNTFSCMSVNTIASSNRALMR